MKKADDGFVDFGSDPAVDALLGQGRRLQTERGLPKAERARKLREREKARARSRVMYDLPEELIEAVARLAAAEETSASQVVGLALRMWLEQVERGTVRVRDYRKPISNPRYGFVLVWENEK